MRTTINLTCVNCHKPLDHLEVLRSADGDHDGFMHGCGITFSRDFMREHYGVDPEVQAPLDVRLPQA